MKYLKFLFALLFTSGAFAQSMELGGVFGLCQYQGDLEADHVTPTSFRPALGLLYRYNVSSNAVAFRGTLTYGQLYGADKHSPESKGKRNLSFTSDLIELSAQMEVSITALVNGYWDVVYRRWENRLPYNLYVTGGAAGFFFNPKTKYNGQTYTLYDKETEVGKDYKRIQMALPVGIGFDMSLGRDRMTRLGIEFIYRKTFTDYLDDVSTGAYPNKDILVAQRKEIDAALSDRSVEITGAGKGISDVYPGSPRADSAKKDSYFTLCFTLTRFINTGTLYR